MFRKILVGVDGSEESKKALNQAVMLAMKFESEIIIISVIPREARMIIIQKEILDDSIMVSTEKMVAELAAEVTAKGINARGITAFGDVASEILKVCEREGCDLIVVGRKGLGKVERFLIGNVALKVVEHARVSVMVVK